MIKRRSMAALTALATASLLVVGPPAAVAGPGGAVYTGFDPGNAVSGVVYTVLPVTVAGTTKYLVGGDFDNVGAANNDNLAMFNADGTVYNGFSPVSALNNGGDVGVTSVREVTIGGSRKFVVTGNFINSGANNNDNITVLNENGTNYSGFASGARLNSIATSVAVDTVGGQPAFVVGGNFYNAGSAGIDRVVRLFANGSVDTSFDPGTQLNSTVRSVAIATIDGTKRYVLGGNFTSPWGNASVAIYNTNGNEYISFLPGSAIGGDVMDVQVVTVAGQTRILVSGSFSDAGSTNNDNTAMLNTNGTVYTGFAPGSRLNSTVYGVAPTTVGGVTKYVAVGSFTNAGSAGNDYISMLNADGTYYTGFDAAGELNFATLAAAMTSADGQPKIFTGGLASGIGPDNVSRIAMFNAPTLDRPRAATNVRVAGTARARLRTARWNAPVGGVTQSVANYRIEVYRARPRQLRYAATVASTRTSVTLNRARLVRGLRPGVHRLLLRVVSQNATGSTATALKVFQVQR